MIRNLLFDLDGTLVDSSGTITQSLSFALERAGVAVPPAAALRAFIGRPLLDIFLLDKAVYELNYELNNRPDWVQIPLRGITDLMSSRVDAEVVL